MQVDYGHTSNTWKIRTIILKIENKQKLNEFQVLLDKTHIRNLYSYTGLHSLSI